MDYKRKKTTAAVYSAIMSAHRDELRAFSSYSSPNGDYFGNMSEGVMMTEFGFDGADCPLIGAETRWDIDTEAPHKRNNERTEYWLCLPNDEEE